MEHFDVILALIGMVVIVASLLSGALERRGVPLVAVFLALGVLLGPWGLGIVDIGFASPELRVIATLALALVLFTDAVSLNTRELGARRALLVRLLGPGTLIPAAILTLAAMWLLELPLAAAAILGAALASSDPVLLRGALRSKALPDDVRTALRLETGMNDIVLLPIVVIAMIELGGSNAAVGPRALTHSLVGLFLLGPLLGAAVGWIGITALGWARRHMGVRRDYESLYALGLAFAAFAAAESVGGSGFVAAFGAGIMIDAADPELCDCFMEYGEATAEMFLLLTFVALGTTLIWSGFDVMHWRTLVFAALALGVRSVVLYPMLGGLGLAARDRALIALLGPRGLSSLLLVLLPVFAGVSGAEGLFAVVCVVVLLSLVIHGGGIALYLGARTPRRAAPAPAAAPADTPAPVSTPALAARDDDDPRLTLDELARLRARGEPLVIADARKDAAYYGDGLKAEGAVRIDPEEPVEDAEAHRLPREATIAVYCA
ncbi:MAG: cation:proton antiporter [Candidatus Eisenbacteria bacterium]|nr:cation:proton antiporter [Candidatus Eisenbacteria bacterium]